MFFALILHQTTKEYMIIIHVSIIENSGKRCFMHCCIFSEKTMIWNVTDLSALIPGWIISAPTPSVLSWSKKTLAFESFNVSFLHSFRISPGEASVMLLLSFSYCSTIIRLTGRRRRSHCLNCRYTVVTWQFFGGRR